MCSEVTSMIDNLESQAVAMTTDAQQQCDSWHEWNKKSTEQMVAYNVSWTKCCPLGLLYSVVEILKGNH